NLFGVPTEFTQIVEFTGKSNAESWDYIDLTLNGQWTVANVNVTVQLYNYSLGRYAQSGEEGYLSYTSGAANTDENRTLSVTLNPENFRDADNNWKVRITGVKSTSTLFDLKVDLIQFTAGVKQYALVWQHTIENVRTTYDRNDDNYTLKINGKTSGDSENIGVYLWKSTTNSWEFVDNLTPTERTITKVLENVDNYLVGNSIYVKYQDWDNTDKTQTTLHLDWVTVEENIFFSSEVKLQIRTSLDNITWTDNLGPDGTNNTYFLNSPASLENIPDCRYFQYIVYFWSENEALSGASGPKIENVQIQYIPTQWWLIESWTGTVTAPAQWNLIESWTGTVRAPTTWNLIESWTITVRASSVWNLIESWTGTIQSPAQWNLIESWVGTVRSPTQWNLIESWTATAQAPTQWHLIESWTGTASSPSTMWYRIESWTATVEAPAQWYLIESWTSTARAPAQWNLIESWTITVRASSVWNLIESWTGAVRAPAEWHPIESWTATIRTTTEWHLIQSWSATVSAPQVWNLIDTWTATLRAQTSWKAIESWTGAIKAPAAWKLVEAWTISVSAPGVPSSSINPITPFWIKATPFTITATASDPSSGGYVVTMKLWYRYSKDKLSWSSWENFGDNTGPNSWSFTAPAGDGYYQFYSIAVDDGGNKEPAPNVADALCGVDTVPPSIVAVVINNNEPSTTSTSVTITVLAVDSTSGVAQMQFSNDGVSWTEWEAFSTTRQYLLQPGIGTRTVYVRVRDNAGLVSAIASDSIELIAVKIKGAAATIASIPSGMSATADLTPFQLCITGLTITAKTELKDVIVAVNQTSYQELLAEGKVTYPPFGIVYHLFWEIETNVPSSSLASVKIHFRLEKAWIQLNGVDEKTISLYRFTNGWQQLPTEYLYEDDTCYHYEATSPGLSVFAAVGERKAIVPVKPIAPIVPELPTVPYEFFTMLAMAGGLAAFSIIYSLVRPSRYYLVLKRLERAVFAKRQRIIGKPVAGPRVKVEISRKELASLKKLQKIYKRRKTKGREEQP
ncbi:MAG: PGF-pre-PGF domain-containing protein, partial [Hadesarchaea archaeon]|nr:PGF-pre-PGF domain-containing protein [Hadesarchaea archaeon]